MFCSNCGAEIPNGSRFCNNCGMKLNNQESPQAGSSRTQVYEGVLHKCPNCGELLDAFVTECPACGYELRGASRTSAVHELSLKLEKAASEKEREELISNFYIPNTKEDIYEFVILASSNLKAGGSNGAAWEAKIEQAYQKASIVFGHTEEFAYVDKLYKESLRKRASKKKASTFGKIVGAKYFPMALPMVIGVLMMLIGWFGGSASGNDDSPLFMLFILGMLLLMGPLLVHGSKSNK